MARFEPSPQPNATWGIWRLGSWNTVLNRLLLSHPGTDLGAMRPKRQAACRRRTMSSPWLYIQLHWCWSMPRKLWVCGSLTISTWRAPSELPVEIVNMVFSLGTLRPPLSSFGGGKRAVIYIRDTITSELLCSSTGQVASFLPLFFASFFRYIMHNELRNSEWGSDALCGGGEIRNRCFVSDFFFEN